MASEPLTFEQMSESDEYLRALIEQHSATLNDVGECCAICFTRIPCDTTSLAASALHRSALLAERDAEVARLAAAEAAIREALYDYDHGDEIGAVAGLRAALAARGGAGRDGE